MFEQLPPPLETTPPDIVLPSSTSSRASSRQSSRSNSSRNHSSEVAAAFPSSSLSIQPILSTPRVSPPLQTTHTPRRDLSLPLHNIASFESNVPYTPTGEEADLYKYYCPLCMLYYQSILKSQCCNNYLCIFCTKDYLLTKHIIDKKAYENKENHRSEELLNEITDNALMNEINCPHCIRKGFSIIKVSRNEEVRDYSMRNNPGINSYPLSAASPVKIGESFEELKRKMIPFRIHNDNIVKSVEKFSSSPRSINEMNTPLVTAYARVSSFRDTSDHSPIVNATPLLLNDDEFDRNDYSPARSERLISTASNSVRIGGIAMLDLNRDERRDGNGSPLLSPQSTYRSRGNSPTVRDNEHEHDHNAGSNGDCYDLSITSAAGDAFSPAANLFARTAPLSARREDPITPQRDEFNERRRSRNEDRVYYENRLSDSVDELSESVESSLVGLRIVHRMDHGLLARDIVQGVFSTAFTQRTVQIQ
jgi:hypothetical protein